jgi:hypothetical protein
MESPLKKDIISPIPAPSEYENPCLASPSSEASKAVEDVSEQPEEDSFATN